MISSDYFGAIVELIFFAMRGQGRCVECLHPMKVVLSTSLKIDARSATQTYSTTRQDVLRLKRVVLHNHKLIVLGFQMLTSRGRCVVSLRAISVVWG